MIILQSTCRHRLSVSWFLILYWFQFGYIFFVVSSSTAQSQSNSGIGCDWHCRTTIAAVTGCVGALICVIVLTWRLRRLHCHAGQPLKHVGSAASISGVPSEYHEDYRIPHTSPQWSPKRSPDYNMVCVFASGTY